jgi:hypothetical protein
MEDSSKIALRGANHPDFPGHGNGTFRTAGCKFDYAFNLVREDVFHCELHLAKTQDRQIGKSAVERRQTPADSDARLDAVANPHPKVAPLLLARHPAQYIEKIARHFASLLTGMKDWGASATTHRTRGASKSATRKAGNPLWNQPSLAQIEANDFPP